MPETCGHNTAIENWKLTYTQHLFLLQNDILIPEIDLFFLK